ncbi:hypothetical protein J6590_060385 [Homalodisca vitripennis]|nr:hypothetical protein J6590_060385 [Homalodisca vitripennis]
MTCIPAIKTYVNRYQKVQNKAVRFMFCLNRQEHVSPFREKVGLAPMEDVCRVLTNSITHKVLCLGEPQYLGHKLSYREEITQRSTCLDRKLHFPEMRL